MTVPDCQFVNGPRSRTAPSAVRFRVPAARVLALGALLAGLSGCGSLQSSYGTMAQVRFIAASANTPGVDFSAGSATVVYNQGFGTPSSYVPLPPGSTRIAAETAGITPSQTLVAATQTLTALHSYTVLVGNTMGALTETVLQDQSTPAPAGQVAFRFLDQVTLPGAVDIYLLAPTGKLAGSTPVVANVSFNGNTGYLNVPAGTYAVTVVPRGTVATAATVPLFTGALLGYEPGAVETVVLIDRTGANSPSIGAILASDFDPSGGI